jgi:hypothetical protein
MVNETKEGAMLRTATAEFKICERHLETLRFRMSLLADTLRKWERDLSKEALTKDWIDN